MRFGPFPAGTARFEGCGEGAEVRAIGDRVFVYVPVKRTLDKLNLSVAAGPKA